MNKAWDSNCTVGGLVSCRLVDKGSHISIAFLVRFLFSGDLPGKSRVPSSLVQDQGYHFHQTKSWTAWDTKTDWIEIGGLHGKPPRDLPGLQCLPW